MILAWDDCVTWRSERTVAPTELPVSMEFVYRKVLKSPNDSAESELIDAYIAAATQLAETTSQRALMPQTWRMTLDRFPPSGVIVLERLPLIGLPTVNYYDSDNAAQTLSGSPSQIQVLTHGDCKKAEVRPLSGETFPSTYSRPDAVTVTYEVGYEDTQDPEFQLICAGIGLKARHIAQVLDERINWGAFWRRVD